jgi:filamentous hemagglutinin
LNDVNVNASRIFTLGGGNIVIWSDLGNIDAGNGAKSSLSLPPPTTEIDPKTGNVTLVFDAGVAGSGIRTIQTSSTEAAGSVNLIAPVGAINAGDAGIGAAGNINLSALVVTGASNINFGGTATGVPPAVSGLTASLSGAASAASSATTSATAGLENSGSKEAAPITEAAVSWLDVFVTGLGEENCKTDDLECLKRQRHE